MAQPHYFLSFDCGATSGRGVLAAFEGGSFHIEEVYRFPSEIVRRDGRMYWDVFKMRDHLVSCIRRLKDRGVCPSSIGIDTWGVDFGLIGADGFLLDLPRCYRDPYTVGIPEKVFEKIPREALYAGTGIQIMNINSIFQLYAMALSGSEALAKARALLFMPDLLSYLLCGNMVCEYTIASTSGMLDQASGQFNTGLLKKLGLRSDILLPVSMPGTRVGEFCGIPVIAVAGHDTASAIAAVPALDGNFAYLSSGTWSLMGIEVGKPVINGESARKNFTNEGGIEGTTRFLKNITGMWLLEECRRIWKAQGKDYSYPGLMEMALAEKDFNGRIDPNDSRFVSPENMVREITESVGVGPLTDAQIVSCIYHSLAACYRETLLSLQEFAPFKIERLHIIGGGSANDLLNQWTANAVGLPVIAGPSEATAVGNVMIQAKAMGLVRDRWEMRRLIAGSFALKTFLPDCP